MEPDSELPWCPAFWIVQSITTVRLVMALAWLEIVRRLDADAAAAYYVVMLLTDVLDGALARRLDVATVGGDWYDTIADRVVNISSTIYGVVIGAPALACALILARELLVAGLRSRTFAVTLRPRSTSAIMRH